MNRPIESLPPTGADRRQAYYAEATSWAADAAASERRMRRIAWWVAGLAGAIALLEAIALVILLPLRTIEPYVVTVDRQTGQTEITQRLKPGGALTQNEAVTQSALVNYVLARETFDRTDLTRNFRNTQWWSAQNERAAYVRLMSANNPSGPLRIYPEGTVIAITVKSVSILGPETALVRFDAERRVPGGAEQIQPYVAAVGFRYSGMPLRAEERFVNPLGFQVTHYRRDAETAAPVAMPATARP